MDIESEIQGHVERNVGVVAALSRHGIDLEKPRPIDCHFWCETEADADGLEQELTKLGLAVRDKRPTAPGSFWNLEAELLRSPAEVVERGFVEQLVRVAANQNSSFDGWGTSV